MKCFAILSVACLAIVSRASAQAASNEAQIRQTRSESNAAIARQDVPGILASMEEEYHAAASAGGFRHSRAEMGETFAARFAEFEDTNYVRTTESVEVSADGRVASEKGQWVGTWTTPRGPVRTGGPYVAFWRKASGRWLIHAELFVPLYCDGAGCD
jgi:ketosteroid isomerase-like protein